MLIIMFHLSQTNSTTMILAPLNKSRKRNFDRAEDFYIFKSKADLVGLTVIIFVISFSASLVLNHTLSRGALFG